MDHSEGGVGEISMKEELTMKLNQPLMLTESEVFVTREEAINLQRCLESARLAMTDVAGGEAWRDALATAEEKLEREIKLLPTIKK